MCAQGKCMRGCTSVGAGLVRAGGVAALVLAAWAARAGVQEEIDEFLKQEDKFGKVEAPAPAAAKAPVTTAAPASELAQALAAKTQELDASRQEIARLKDVIKRIWEASKAERKSYYYNMGCVHRAYRQYKAAEGEFLKALETDPKDAATHYNLAILYDDDLKDKAKARQHYERFLELAPGDKDAARVREWLATLP